MASKQIFEEVYMQTNIILCIKPPKVYLIEENMCSVVTILNTDFQTLEDIYIKSMGSSYLPFSHD